MDLRILKTIKEATKSVPFVKYALGLAGIVSVIALVRSYSIDLKVGLWSTVIILCLMLVLFLLAHIAVQSGTFLFLPAQTLLWGIVILFLISVFFLVTSVFFQWPRDLSSILGIEPGKVDYTVYFRNKYNSVPVSLGDGKLVLRFEGKDYEANFIEEGTYKFLSLDRNIFKERPSQLVMKDVPKYCFENYKKQAGFDLEGKTRDIDLIPDTNYLRITGNISYKAKALPRANIQLINMNLTTSTDDNGYYKLDLPPSTTEDHFNIKVSAKGYPTRTYEVVLGKQNPFDIANE
ncbi:MAG: carboxypeptidase-like regulatory domain-containing protein [Chitinophagaceae bacterium]|nr:carboxypeptidase-like regulatory domain-containing protein [Chitinophagaceae bacterium]